MNVLGYLATGYVTTSILLFCFPNIIHKKKTHTNKTIQQAIDGKRILRICHRGAPRYTTQNTVQGFRKVITETDMLQMDVCQTKDKILVVHHDHSLLRTCGVNKLIQDLNYNELPKFKQQIQLDFATNNKTITSNNEKIPTLQKVFQLFQGIPMDIELKTPTQSSINEINRLIKQYDRGDITFVGIRNKMQERLYQTNKELNLFFNDAAVFKLLLTYLTGLLPFMKIKQSSLQIPLYTTEFHQWKRQSSLGNEWKVDAFFNFVKFSNFISGPLIWHLKRRGIITMFWVCNEEEHYERAIRLGAQGIMTDDPYLLNNYLKKNKNKTE